MKLKRSESLELVKKCCRALDDKKAGDLRVLDVHEQSSITDFLVVATGTSEPHLRALRIEIEKVLDAAKAHIVGMDAQQNSGWMVIDAFDLMVHLFLPESRQNYRLENLWKDAPEIALNTLLAPDIPVTAKPKKTVVKKKTVSLKTKTADPKKKAVLPTKKKAPAKKKTAPKAKKT